MKTYKLLTPGPLTTTDTVKQEMLFDHCTWDDDYKKLIYNELRHGNSWRRTRDKQAICKECIYKYLCPSPSNYEIAIQKPNLCNL